MGQTHCVYTQCVISCGSFKPCKQQCCLQPCYHPLMDIVTDNVTRAQQKQSENWQHCASTQSCCVTVPDVLKVFINVFLRDQKKIEAFYSCKVCKAQFCVLNNITEFYFTYGHKPSIVDQISTWIHGWGEFRHKWQTLLTALFLSLLCSTL